MVETGRYKNGKERVLFPKIQLAFYKLLEIPTVRNLIFALFFASIIYYYLDGLVTESRKKIVYFQVVVEDPRVHVSEKRTQIQVTLRGPKDAYNRLELQPVTQKIIFEDLEGKEKHQKKINLEAQLSKNVPNDFTILKIQPKSVTIDIIRIESKMAKILSPEIDTSNLPANYKIINTTCNPLFIRLTGPSLELGKYKTVKTEKIILEQNTFIGQHSLVVQANLPESIHCAPFEVKFQIVEEIEIVSEVEVALLVKSPGLQNQIKKIAPLEVKLTGPDYLLRPFQNPNNRLKAYVDLTDIIDEQAVLSQGTPVKRQVKFFDLPEGITISTTDLSVNVEFIKIK